MRGGAARRLHTGLLFFVTALAVMVALPLLAPPMAVVYKPGWKPEPCSNPGSFKPTVKWDKWREVWLHPTVHPVSKTMWIRVDSVRVVKVESRVLGAMRVDHSAVVEVKGRYNTTDGLSWVLELWGGGAGELGAEGGTIFRPKIRKVLKGEGSFKFTERVPTVQASEKGVGLVSITVIDSKEYLLSGMAPGAHVPGVADVTFLLPSLRLTDRLFAQEADVRRFEAIYGLDSSKWFDTCMIKRYGQGDWALPEFDLEVSAPPAEAGSGSLALKLTLVPRGGLSKADDVFGVIPKLTIRGPASRPDMVDRGMLVVGAKVTELPGEFTKQVDASKYLRYPGYYVAELTAPWGGYILRDREVFYVPGEPPKPASPYKPPAASEEPVVAVAQRDVESVAGGFHEVKVSSDQPVKARVDWGDGSVSEAVVAGERVFRKAYDRPGLYEVRVKAGGVEESLPLEVEPPPSPAESILTRIREFWLNLFESMWGWFLEWIGA